MKRRNIVVLGSTGSIGTNCLDVVENLPDRLNVIGLSAHKNWQQLFDQARQFQPRFVCVTDPGVAKQVDSTQIPSGVEFLSGLDGILRMVTEADVDIVLTAIVGSAGLEGTWAALEAGKTIALANKETLVMAGQLVMDLAKQKKVPVLPVDSEHNAIYQVINCGSMAEVDRIVLTASGGPFRGKTRQELLDVSVADALNHPTWRMGPKITVDSATLMNKTLEVIEARWLFDMPTEKIDVVVHPESMIHSFVEFRDGSVLAQLSPPDMRLPIQYALTYPERLSGPTRRLNWREIGSLHFEQPDFDTFPALELGFEVAKRGGTSGAVLNAANEVAVEHFLAEKLPFMEIPQLCRSILEHHNFIAHPTLSELYTVDRWARQEVGRWIARKNSLNMTAR